MIRTFPAALAAALLASLLTTAHAADTPPREPYGIALEGFAYPYPVHQLPLVNDGEQLSMAYMDVTSAQPNGRTVVLLHGRNFPSSYWAPVIKMLSEAGFSVVVLDQIGFGNDNSENAASTTANTTGRSMTFARRTTNLAARNTPSIASGTTARQSRARRNRRGRRSKKRT